MNTMILSVPSHICGLIFDCDGTLADTMPLHWESWHEEFSLHGLTCPQEFLDTHKGAYVAEIVREYNRVFDTELDSDQFAFNKEKRSLEKLRTVKPIQPVVDIVHQYQGILPMAVVSGGNRTNVMLTIDVIGLKDAFEIVLTADDGYPSKPAPDMFLEAARLIGVSPESCQVYEDGDLGLKAAKNAGMSAVDVRPLFEETINLQYSK
ncbi:HAD-IA family hydrolase [candidate division KSB1 bacterium]|nr:HAD-IA family hydrolase [candidate division KSB1 bacterium]